MPCDKIYKLIIPVIDAGDSRWLAFWIEFEQATGLGHDAEHADQVHGAHLFSLSGGRGFESRRAHHLVFTLHIQIRIYNVITQIMRRPWQIRNRMKIKFRGERP